MLTSSAITVSLVRLVRLRYIFSIRMERGMMVMVSTSMCSGSWCR